MDMPMQRPQPLSGRRADQIDPQRRRVLIVDAHGPSRQVCADYCDLFDHLSETAEDGEGALAALRRGRFSAVVMSVHTDAESGLATLRAIRALPGPASDVPIIGLTAAGREDEAQRWLGAGFAGVIAKPVTAARLFAALSSVVDQQADPARSWAPAS